MKRTIVNTLLYSVLTLGGTLLAQTPVVLLQDSFDANTGGTSDLNVTWHARPEPMRPSPTGLANGPDGLRPSVAERQRPEPITVGRLPQSTSSLEFRLQRRALGRGLKISFDLDSMPTFYGGTPDNWGWHQPGPGLCGPTGELERRVTHFGILFRAAGTLQAFDGSGTVSPDPEPVYSTYLPGTTNHIDIIITDLDGNPFDGNGDTVIDVYANGSPSPVWSYTKTGGYAHNFINVQGSWRAHLDNLTVHAA